MNGPANPRADRTRLLALATVMLAAFFVFKGALDNGFVDWDDPEFIKDNPMVHSLDRRNLEKMAVSFQTANWHPLTWISHALDYRLFRLDPRGHHFTSVALHVLNSVMVFLLFARILAITRPGPQAETSNHVGSAAAALWFAVHPLRVESVAWVSERKDVLCAFFVLAVYLAYLSYAEARKAGARYRSWPFAALSLFALALLSKPMAVTVPLTLLLMDAFVLDRYRSRADLLPLLWEKLPFFVLSLAVGTVTLAAQSRMGAVVPIDYLGADKRILNAASGLLFYMEKTLWPSGLSPLYPLPDDLSWGNPRCLLAVVTLLALTGWTVWMRKRGKPVFLAIWAYYLITLLPVIGIVQVGRQGAADRYAYLPTLGFYLLAARGISFLWTGDRRARHIQAYRAAVVLGGLAVASVLGYATVQQNRIWKDSLSLWGHVVERHPRRFSAAYFSLGKAYAERGQLREAAARYKTALKLAPRFVYAINGLGLVYLEQKKFADAEAEFEKALAIRPDAAVHVNLGTAYYLTGRLEEAERQFQSALRLRPDNLEAHNDLGLVYEAMGRPDDAEKAYKTALSVDFDFPLAHLNLGNLYRKRGLARQAETELRLGQYLQAESRGP
ncbi:MAG: tetratricopeptide repeat protein [Nitrospinae bacterium]|nr:tetratricopeptide repeat protein [Nitrospinota bacterium]